MHDPIDGCLLCGDAIAVFSNDAGKHQAKHMLTADAAERPKTSEHLALKLHRRKEGRASRERRVWAFGVFDKLWHFGPRLSLPRLTPLH
jgi:hypothetical protein